MHSRTTRIYQLCMTCAVGLYLALAIWMPFALAQKAANTSLGQPQGYGVDSSSIPTGHELDLLKSCYNHNYTRTTLGFIRWLRGTESRLYLYRGWWSAHAPPSAPLTVFTMASMDRLGLLEAQCRSFAGPHVAAVYLPLRVAPEAAEKNGAKKAKTTKRRGALETAAVGASGGPAVGASGSGEGGEGGGVMPGHEALGWLSEGHQEQVRKAERSLQELFNRIEAAAAAGPAFSNSSSGFGSCAPHLMLFIELVADPHLLALMPTNALRNAAMLAVRTPLSLMLDADLSLSPLLSALVHGQDTNRLLGLGRAATNRTLSVLAAWETSGRMTDDEANAMVGWALKGSKERLYQLWLNDKLQVFSWLGYRKGHGPTNQGHWLRAEEPYQASYSEGYEPWGVLARLSDPGYDEHFRGWIKDKVMHVATLAYLNYTFVVQHDMWAIHRPHKLVAASAIMKKEEGKAANAELVNSFRQRVYGKHRNITAYQCYTSYVELTYKDALIAMRNGSYVPYRGAQFTRCLDSLPWWRVPEEVLGQGAGRGDATGWVAQGEGSKDERGVPLPWLPPWRLAQLRQRQQR